MAGLSRRTYLAALAALLILLVPAAAAQAAKPTAAVLVRANLGLRPLTRIRDRVFRSSTRRARTVVRAAQAAQLGWGGAFYATDGEAVRVYTSPRYRPDTSVNQSYANFLTGLVHGPELSSLTVYIAPYDEMQSLCSPEADACYIDDEDVLVTTGNVPPDGVAVEDLVAHEYGHHIANHRLNDLGKAIDWGPEYWASYEHVCERQEAGTAFPSDEGAHYALNPGEAWAETYRLLNGSHEPWDSSDPSFFPDAGALAAARRDVLQPFQGDEYIDRSGHFGRRGSGWRNIVVPVENDGTVDLQLRSSGSLDADIYLYASRGSTHLLQRAAHFGRREHLRGSYCGYRHLDVAVRRYSGSGSFKLRASLPYFSG